MKKRGVMGRRCAAGEPRTVFYKVRLTPKEKAAVEAMEVNLADMIRALASSYLKRKDAA